MAPLADYATYFTYLLTYSMELWPWHGPKPMAISLASRPHVLGNPSQLLIMLLTYFTYLLTYILTYLLNGALAMARAKAYRH